MARLVSAIITTSNRFEFFKKALISIKNQTYKDIEIIVVDGGDGKQVESYIKKYSDIIYITSDNNHPNVLRNLGIRSANGNWVSFLDDDDTWVPEKIELQIKCFLTNKFALTKQFFPILMFCLITDPLPMKVLFFIITPPFTVDLVAR